MLFLARTNEDNLMEGCSSFQERYEMNIEAIRMVEERYLHREKEAIENLQN